MYIKQVLNNNVVVAVNDLKREIVIFGTGIGFHAKKDDLIEENKIQKIFECKNNAEKMVSELSPEIIGVVTNICNYAKEKYDIEIGDEVFVLLADHISFAIKRLREGMELDNPFLSEVKEFFKNEYKIGLYASVLIKEKYGVVIPEEEVGYICMHLIASEYHQNRSDVHRVFKIIDTSINFIREVYLKDVKEDTLSYNRLVTHIKFFAKRYAEDSENENEDALLDLTIKDTFKEEVQCMDQLSDILYKQFGKKVTQSERNYIILHLRNCRNNK